MSKRTQEVKPMTKEEENREMIRYFNIYVKENGIGDENHIYSMDEFNAHLKTWSPLLIASGVSVGHYDVKDNWFTVGRGDVFGLKIVTFKNWEDENSPMSILYNSKNLAAMKQYWEKQPYKAVAENVRNFIRKAIDAEEN